MTESRRYRRVRQADSSQKVPDVPRLRDFEVHCHRCGVTFPVETRSCLHCGQKVGKLPQSEIRFGPLIPASAPTETAQEEPETSRGPMRVISGIMWTLLIVVGSFYRLCSG